MWKLQVFDTHGFYSNINSPGCYLYELGQYEDSTKEIQFITIEFKRSDDIGNGQ